MSNEVEAVPCYTVSLAGAPGLSARERIELEVRYIVELERVLGGPARVDELCQLSAIRQEMQIDGLRLPPGPDADQAFDDADRQAEAAAWQGRGKPAGAHFTVTCWPGAGGGQSVAASEARW